jgi:DNA-binding ferritin-like protein
VSRPHEESEKERVWRVLSEAGLIDILPDEFAERIKEAKNVVMGRLSELLELTTDIQERESAAFSLATLKKLERTVSRRGRRSSD